MKKSKKWIQKTGVNKPGHRGMLHRALGVSQGQPIPVSKLMEALHSNNPHLKHMAQFAANMKGMRRSGKGRKKKA